MTTSDSDKGVPSGGEGGGNYTHSGGGEGRGGAGRSTCRGARGGGVEQPARPAPHRQSVMATASVTRGTPLIILRYATPRRHATTRASAGSIERERKERGGLRGVAWRGYPHRTATRALLLCCSAALLLCCSALRGVAACGACGGTDTAVPGRDGTPVVGAHWPIGTPTRRPERLRLF